MKLSLEQIAEWTGAQLAIPHGAAVAEATGYSRGDVHATGYSIDTRTLAPGDLFFAIRGERFDAHDFVADALAKGACAAVVTSVKARDLLPEAHAHPLLLVEDPLVALQRLAAAVRRHWGKRVVAVTGSAGKTTTKEAIATVLETQFRVRKSKGNLNNHFGLPLQLLKLAPEDEVAVVEMGMSAAGEIAALCQIAAPDWGVVTNVGNAHAEGFADGIAGVARAKYELVAGLSPQARERAVAFLNADDAYVSQFGRDFPGRAVYYATKAVAAAVADVRGEEIEELGPAGSRVRAATADDGSASVHLALLGRHNVSNALAAIAVGLHAGIPLARCVEAIASLKPEDKRGELIEWRGATIINDCYNSNPEALQSMIRTLAAVPARRRILVAGEMLELGSRAAELHRECGAAAGAAGIDQVIGVRGLALEIVAGAATASSKTRAIFVETPQAAGEWLKEHLKAGDAVLLKASRGVRLEQALAILTAG
ncbi:MAG TPA: UDP-N-acetylmuramoyl-tripeptide--D-alanyl-D-alanine ligase [Acidobacteriaceae bacterium]